MGLAGCLLLHRHADLEAVAGTRCFAVTALGVVGLDLKAQDAQLLQLALVAHAEGAGAVLQQEGQDLLALREDVHAEVERLVACLVGRLVVGRELLEGLGELEVAACCVPHVVAELAHLLELEPDRFFGAEALVFDARLERTLEVVEGCGESPLLELFASAAGEAAVLVGELFDAQAQLVEAVEKPRTGACTALRASQCIVSRLHTYA